VARADFRGDSGEFARQILDFHAAERLGEAGLQPLAAEQAAAERDVEHPEHAPQRGGAGELLHFGELSGREGAADDRADGRSADDVGGEARILQFGEDADMRPAAGDAGAEREADGALEARRAAGPSLVMGLVQRDLTTHRQTEHGRSSRGPAGQAGSSVHPKRVNLSASLTLILCEA
jgi:hypothetical protein